MLLFWWSIKENWMGWLEEFSTDKLWALYISNLISPLLYTYSVNRQALDHFYQDMSSGSLNLCQKTSVKSHWATGICLEVIFTPGELAITTIHKMISEPHIISLRIQSCNWISSSFSQILKCSCSFQCY